jgi:hypothetical protein
VKGNGRRLICRTKPEILEDLSKVTQTVSLDAWSWSTDLNLAPQNMKFACHVMEQDALHRIKMWYGSKFG